MIFLYSSFFSSLRKQFYKCCCLKIESAEKRSFILYRMKPWINSDSMENIQQYVKKQKKSFLSFHIVSLHLLTLHSIHTFFEQHCLWALHSTNSTKHKEKKEGGKLRVEKWVKTNEILFQLFSLFFLLMFVSSALLLLLMFLYIDHKNKVNDSRYHSFIHIHHSYVVEERESSEFIFSVENISSCSVACQARIYRKFVKAKRWNFGFGT